MESEVLSLNPATAPLSSFASLGKSFTFLGPQLLICKERRVAAASLGFVKTGGDVCTVSERLVCSRTLSYRGALCVAGLDIASPLGMAN